MSISCQYNDHTGFVNQKINICKSPFFDFSIFILNLFIQKILQQNNKHDEKNNGFFFLSNNLIIADLKIYTYN